MKTIAEQPSHTILPMSGSGDLRNTHRQNKIILQTNRLHDLGVLYLIMRHFRKISMFYNLRISRSVIGFLNGSI